MTNFSVPGVYISQQEYTLNPLQIDTRCLSAFAGISEKGPVDEPILINSFDEYIKTFGGFDTEGVLPLSIYSYFKCGGKECIVTRVAHKESVRCAELDIKCQSGAFKLQALTPGVWGNYICTKIWYEYEKISNAIISISETFDCLCLNSVEDIEVGDVIEFNLNDGHTVCRQIDGINENEIHLSYPLNIMKNYKDSLNEVAIKKVYYSVILSNKDKKNETYLHLSMNKNDERYFASFINKRSRICKIIENNPSGAVLPVYSEYARGGNDGIADITAGDFIGHYRGLNDFRGIGTFESREDISLISVPDICWLLSQAGKNQEERLNSYRAVQNALIEQAERFIDRFAVLDMPDYFDTVEAENYAKKIDSAFAAIYYPYINVIDPLDSIGCKSIRIPPSGAICGSIVMTDGEYGIYHAPANCIIQGSVGLSKKITQGEHSELYDKGINVLKYFPGSGVKIWGAKTLSSNIDWRYISVRRTFSRICSALKKGTQWAVFENNDKNLRKRLVRQVSGFLIDLWMKGYLAGSSAEKGFFVRCDEELNPPEKVDNGILTFEVGIAIVRPTEFFQITITAEKDGASVYIQE